MSTGVIYGKYYLLGRLNRGGMAEVFLAKARSGHTGRLWALKRTLPEFSNDEEFISMFRDEARIARNLRHRNICQIEDSGEHNGQQFIVMEFVHGKDLKVIQKRLTKRQKALPLHATAYIVAKIARALEVAHQKTDDSGASEQVVHRDVSPQNILLSYDGVPKLIDFGIAKAKDRIAQTQVGSIKGKIAYMSPEQATGGHLDGRSDLFSLGVVLFELATGQNPFKGSQDRSTLQRICTAQYTPVQTLNGDIPAELVAIIEKALRKEPQDRFATGSDMADALEQFVANAVQESSLAAFMQDFFSQDYQNEKARIEEYEAIEPPPLEPPPSDDTVTETSPQEPADNTHTDVEHIADATAVAPSYDLAEAIKLLREKEVQGEDAAHPDVGVDTKEVANPLAPWSEQVEDDSLSDAPAPPPPSTPAAPMDSTVIVPGEPEPVAPKAVQPAEVPGPEKVAALLPIGPPPGVASAPRRRAKASSNALLTSTERTILAALAMLGAACVGAAYLYLNMVAQ